MDRQIIKMALTQKFLVTLKRESKKLSLTPQQTLVVVIGVDN